MKGTALVVALAVALALALPGVMRPPRWTMEAGGPASADVGRGLYAMHCGHCHEPDARGGGCPDLRRLQRVEPSFLYAWLAGPQQVQPNSPMPRIPLRAEEIRDLVAYLKSLPSNTHSISK